SAGSDPRDCCRGPRTPAATRPGSSVRRAIVTRVVRATTAAPARTLRVRELRLALRRIERLQSRPALCECVRNLAGLGTQQHEVVRGAEARMLEQAQRAPALRLVETHLQAAKLADGLHEPARQRDSRLLRIGDVL